MSQSRSRRIALPSPIGLADLWSARVGAETPRDLWVDQQSAARILREQTHDLAERLERQGICCRDTARSLHVVGLVTGDAEQMTAWRNVNVLPAVQSRNTRAMLTTLAYWMDCVPANQRRMLVVSGGWVPLEQYRQEHQALGRRISRLAADPVLAEAGVEIVYRNIENTVQRDELGPKLNLHSHIIIRSRRALGAKRWAALMDHIRARFPKGYAHDSRIEQPAEAVKYAFKPSELLELSGEELAQLARASFGLRYYVPMGELRELRQQLEPREGIQEDTGEVVRLPGRKLVRVRLEGGKTAWRTIERQSVKHPAPDPDREPVEPRDIVLAITPPQPRFSPKSQPCLVVMNYSGDHDRLIKRRNLDELRAFAAALYAAHHDDNCPKPKNPTPLPSPAGRDPRTQRPPPNRLVRPLAASP